MASFDLSHHHICQLYEGRTSVRATAKCRGIISGAHNRMMWYSIHVTANAQLWKICAAAVPVSLASFKTKSVWSTHGTTVLKEMGAHSVKR